MLHYYVRQITILGCTCLLTLTLPAQVEDESPLKLQHKAEKYFDEGDYYQAYLHYMQLVKSDSTNRNFHYHLGVSKLQLRAHKYEAIQELYKAGPDVKPEWYYYAGQCLHLHNHFEEAIVMFRKYKFLKIDKEYTDEEVDEEMAHSLTAMQFILAPANITVGNAGPTVNSKYPEYAPLISGDGKKIYFTSRRPYSESAVLDASGEYYEDIYTSTLESNGWTIPMRLPAPVNTQGHDASVGLTADASQLFIFRSNETLPTGALYHTEIQENNSWSEPVMLDEAINSAEYVEPSACISPDGNTIYFSSNREGGLGGKDIYRLVKLPNGKWSQALNLGPGINTAHDEDSPFIHPDGKTMYFSSTGHKGMGGYDIYSSISDSNGRWSAAVNMGYPLNTPDDDIHFVITEDSKTAYYSSARPGGVGEADLYSAWMDGETHELLIATGYVFDKTDSTSGVAAKITLVDLTDNKLAGIFASNKNTGKFILLLNPHHDYSLIVESSGHHTFSEHLIYSNTTIKVFVTPSKE